MRKIVISIIWWIIMISLANLALAQIKESDDPAAAKRKKTIDKMVKTMKDVNESGMMRKVAIMTLVKMNAKEAIPDLIPLLKDKEPEIRCESALGLSKLGAKEALPEIRPLLMDDNGKVRAGAAIGVGRLSSREEAIPYLRKLLKDGKESDTRGAAAEGLAEFGAKDAIPDMIIFLKETVDKKADNDSSGFRDCISALGTLEAKEAIPDLVKLFRRVIVNIPNKEGRDFALWGEAIVLVPALSATLGRLGAKEIVPDLIKLLEDKEYESNRSDFAQALGGLGDKAAIPSLIKLLGHQGNIAEDVRIRGWAAISLVELGAKDKVPQEITKDIKNIIRWNAGYWLGYPELRANNALKELETKPAPAEQKK